MIASGVYDGRPFEISFSNVRELVAEEKVCGVYGISGVFRAVMIDTSLYVGSAKDCIDRKNNGHLYLIRNEKHFNPHLQRAILKDGVENFKFLLLEETLPEKRIEREQNWLDYYNSLETGDHPKILFNINEIAEQPPHDVESRRKAAATKSKTYIITFPDGHEEIHKNLVEFSKIHGLHRASLAKTATGMQKEHRGFKARYITDEKQRYVDNTWKLKNNHKAVEASKQFTTREYIITFPNGEEKQIRNLKQFSEQRGLSYSSMQNLARGVCKAHKGYKVRKVEQS